MSREVLAFSLASCVIFGIGDCVKIGSLPYIAVYLPARVVSASINDVLWLAAADHKHSWSVVPQV